MDTTDPEIEFDDEGVCNHCYRYAARARNELMHDVIGQAAFRRLIEEIKHRGRGNEYDCIIGVSGGVDSTYVAYRVKDLGLRPLAVHVDNGWDSELAVGNIEKTLKALQIDLCTRVLDWDEFRDIQLAFLKASVPNCEIPSDHAIGASLYEEAVSRGIKYVISGGNVETEGILPRKWTYDNRDFMHLAAVHRRYGTRPMESYPHYGLLDFFHYFAMKRLKFVRVLNAAPYRKAAAKETITRDLGWVDYGGKHYESVYTRFYQAHILPEKFGFDKRLAHLSTLIASGQMDRGEALVELERPIYPEGLFRSDYEFVLKKLGLTEAAFRLLMAEPPRDHSSLPGGHVLFTTNRFGLLTAARWLALRL
ncbi:MAG: N-acetyl sugar amidotransferase [Deltaproteobacteria bacterium]|nr:N-acetyl sugar amidotransferase [Deltaproteobacteria bacterium]